MTPLAPVSAITQGTTAIGIASWIEEKTTQIYSYCSEIFKSIEQSYLRNRANGCIQEMVRSFKEIERLETTPNRTRAVELNKQCRNFLQRAHQLQAYANSYSNDHNEIDEKLETLIRRLGNTDLGIRLQNSPLESKGSPLINLRKLFITEHPPYLLGKGAVFSLDEIPWGVQQLLAERFVEYNVLALSLVSADWRELTNQNSQNTLSHFSPTMQKYLLGFSPPLSAAQMQIQAGEKILEELKLLHLDPIAIDFNRNDLSTYQRAEQLIEAKNFSLFYAAVQHQNPICPTNDEQKILQKAQQLRQQFNQRQVHIRANTFVLDYQDFGSGAGTFTRLPQEINILTNLSYIRYETRSVFGHAIIVPIDWQRDRDGRFISVADEFTTW